MKINELFEPGRLLSAVNQKLVNIRPHDNGKLFIANYSDLAQYSNQWDEVTLNCRGLIYEEETGEILARPWKKFFNLGDAKAPYIAFDAWVEVTDKMDGSLGILYAYDSNVYVSTRGSFHSDQAEWATKHFRTISGLDLGVVEKYTFLFEIIYPGNRIVVDYGKFEGLVLLGAVEIETGHYLGPDTAAALLRWPGLTTEVMPYRSINDVLASEHRNNAEGLVIRFGDKQVKYKYPDYVELHRLISNLSEKSVWTGLSSGKTIEEMCDGLPDEFHGFVKEYGWKLRKQAMERWAEISKSYVRYRNLLPDLLPVNRKDFAWMIRNDPDKRYMFALLDDKPILDMIWQELKPSGNAIENDSRQPFVRAGDSEV